MALRIVQLVGRYGFYSRNILFVNRFQPFSNDSKPIPKNADTKPVLINMEIGKSIWWCSCGYSSDQPRCDGSHERENTGMKPIEFVASEAKKYAFCACKLSKKQPLCDGSHKQLKNKE